MNHFLSSSHRCRTLPSVKRLGINWKSPLLKPFGGSKTRDAEFYKGVWGENGVRRRSVRKGGGWWRRKEQMMWEECELGAGVLRGISHSSAAGVCVRTCVTADTLPWQPANQKNPPLPGWEDQLSKCVHTHTHLYELISHLHRKTAKETVTILAKCARSWQR